MTCSYDGEDDDGDHDNSFIDNAEEVYPTLDSLEAIEEPDVDKVFEGNFS